MALRLHTSELKAAIPELKAGDRVRFRPVSVAAAQAVYRRQRQALDGLQASLR